jgi:predicted PolB exonuclease-like 3'-5' exonuclease
MSEKYLVMDIETIPNPEVPWDPPTDGKNNFPPTHCHKIVAIAGLIISLDRQNGNRVEFLGAYGRGPNPTEKEILEDFLNSPIIKPETKLVTFNGRNFDVAVIVARMMRYGFVYQKFFRNDFTNRYAKDGTHLDLCDHMSNYGASHRFKLGDACQNIGLPGKFDVDGDDVKGLVEAGKISTVRSYCISDVVQTGIILMRWLYVQGYVSSVVCNNVILGIISATKGKNDVLLTKLIELTNQKKLLLPPATPEELAEKNPEEDDDILPF